MEEGIWKKNMEDNNVFEPVFYDVSLYVLERAEQSAGGSQTSKKYEKFPAKTTGNWRDRASRTKAWQQQSDRDRNTVVQKKSGVVHLEILNIHTHM